MLIFLTFEKQHKQLEHYLLLQIKQQEHALYFQTNLLIQETGTLGVRIRTSERFIVPRTIESIPVTIEGQNFTIHYKTANNNLKNFKLEFEDVKQISNSLNKSSRETRRT